MTDAVLAKWLREWEGGKGWLEPDSPEGQAVTALVALLRDMLWVLDAAKNPNINSSLFSERRMVLETRLRAVLGEGR